jgi:hypothetical protein
MRKILTIGTAAFLASVAMATAGTKPVNITFDGTCDGLTLTPNGALYASNHVVSCAANENGGGTEPQSNPIPGIGIVVKKGPNNPDKVIAVSDSNLDPQGLYVTYVIQMPFVSGNQWTAYGTTDGVSLKEVGAGTYSVK